MFKKIFTSTIVAVLFSFAVPAYAQDYDDIDVDFGIKAGWLFLQDEPLSDSIENNWIIGADLKVWFAGGFGIGGEIQFTTKDETEAMTAGADIEVESTLIPIHVDLFYRFQSDDSEFTPYVGAGVSFIFADLTANGYLDTGGAADVDVDDTAIGFNVIGGVEFNQFFIEGQWYWAETEFDMMAQISDDEINTGGFSVWVGYRF